MNISQIRRWRTIIFDLVILLAGIAIGVAVTLIVILRGPMFPMGGPEHIAEKMFSGLKHDLRLSDSQQDQIRPLIRKHMERIDAIRMEARPRIDAEIKSLNEDISAILNPEQKELWQELLKRMPKPGSQGAPPIMDRGMGRPFQHEGPGHGEGADFNNNMHSDSNMYSDSNRP